MVPRADFCSGASGGSGADPADQGLGRARSSASSTAGWSPTTIPRAVNAGDFSIASYLGTVHWFRKDFRLPSRAPARSGCSLRVGQYRAKVWLNGSGWGSRRLVPALRAARASGRSGGAQPAGRQSRRPAPEFDIPPLSNAPAAIRGRLVELHGHPAGGLPAACNNLDLEDVFVRPRLRCPSCAARIFVDLVANFASRGRRARIVGSIAGKPFRFGQSVRRPRFAQVQGRHGSATRGCGSPDRPHLYTVRLAA